MVRAEWTTIAQAISEYRSAVSAAKPDFHNGEHALTYWAARMTTVDEIAKVIARALGETSRRFDVERFITICIGKKG